MFSKEAAIALSFYLLPTVYGVFSFIVLDICYITPQKTLAFRDYLAFTLRSAITECIHKTMAIDRKAA